MANSLSLITWNGHGLPTIQCTPRRLERIADRVLQELPDLALFQEVWFPTYEHRLIRTLEPSYELVPMDVRNWPMRKSGLLAFVRRRDSWRATGSCFHEFRAEASDWRFWELDGLGDKGILEIHLEHEGMRVVVLNTHLQSDYPWNDFRDIRKEQLSELRALAERQDPEQPLIVAGDFNTQPNEAIFRDQLDFWTDLTARRREECACGTHLDCHGVEQGWIDYVLARTKGAWEVGAKDVRLIPNNDVDDPYSDHHGLYATLDFSPRTGAAASLIRAAALQALAGPATRRQWLVALWVAAIGEDFGGRGVLHGGKSK